MKRAQPLSTINKKLTSVPELPYKKGLLNSSPKPKEKRNAKSQYDKIEPMVLRSPPTGESVVRYALPIPSSKTKELIAEDEMVRSITKHLKMVVTALENTYGTVDEDEENTLTKPKEEGVSLSVGDDMNAFLQYCSQFAAQMEEAVKEERNILESLFKWFQQQVNQIEEIGKDQSISEDLPSDEETLSLNITQIVKLVHRFEELKTRLKGRKGSLLSKHAEKDTGSMRSYEAIEKQIEEFIKSHSAYEAQVASETEPGAPYSVTKRMNVMIRIFENQTNTLERALNDQSIAESKYKQMETDFQMLLLEKTLLESEIQRMKESEKAKPSGKEERTKRSTRQEKKKEKDSERKSPSRELDLVQIQKEAEELKMEKKALQEQLKWALQEAEKNKNQLEYVLQHEMETLKDERSKTKVERGVSRSKGMREDSKYSHSMENDAQLGRQQQNYDQVPPEKSKSLEKTQPGAPVVGPLAGRGGVPGVPAFPPEMFKSFAALPLIQEHLELDSTELEETEMWSLVSFPNLAEEVEKDEASEHVLSHTEAEQVEVSSKMPNEIIAPEDLLPEAPVTTVRQLYRQGRRKPLFITAKPPEHLSLISRTQSEIENLEATRYENVITEYEEQDKKFGREDSITDINPKEQKGSKTGKLYLYTHEEESERMVYEEPAKAKVPAKKPDASKGKGLARDEGALSPEIQGSLSKADVQTKKQKMYKRERFPASHEVPDRSFEHQDSNMIFEIQAKKLRIFKPESVHSEVSDKNIRLEDQKTQSSSQVQLKKQKSLGGEIFTIHFAAPDDVSTHLHQESSLEFQAQAERGTTSEDARLGSVPVEYQKKDGSADNLFPEKKLIITRSPTQNKKYASPQQESAENENVNRFFTNEDLELQSLDQKRQKDENVNRFFTNEDLELQSLDQKRQKDENVNRFFTNEDLELQSLDQKRQKDENVNRFFTNEDLELQSLDQKRQKDENVNRFFTNEDLELQSLDQKRQKDENVNRFFTNEDLELQSLDQKRQKDENVNRFFTNEDLELQSLDQKRQKAKTKSVTDVQESSEPPTTLNPMISEIIFRLDMDRVIENDLQNMKETFKQPLLKSEFKARSKPGLEMKSIPSRPKPKEPVKTGWRKQDDNLNIIKGTKLLGTPIDQHNMSLSPRKDITPGLSSMKTKPQENVNAKYPPPKTFPTKVINLLPFTSEEANVESSTPYENVIPKPFYRTSRGSSGIPTTLQQLLNRKIPGALKPNDINKQNTDLENQLRISVISPKKYVHKGLSKTRKLRKKGVESRSNLHTSTSSIRKQKLKEQRNPVKSIERSDELPNNMKTLASAPKIKVLKELSKTSLSNNLLKSRSAAKKLEFGEQPPPVNLNDEDAIIYYNLRGSTSATNKDLTAELSKTIHFYDEVGQRSSAVHMPMSAVRKRKTTETSKTTNLEKEYAEVENSLQIPNLAASISELKGNLYENVDEETNLLHMSTSAVMRYLTKEASKTSSLKKEVVKGSRLLRKSTSSVKKRFHKDKSKTKKLGKNVGEGTSMLRTSATAKKKRVLKDHSKTSNLEKQIIKGTGILRKSASKKHVPKGLFKSTNIGSKGAQPLRSLHTSTSTTKKNVLKGQPKPTTLGKKHVDRLNNLVPSTYASSKSSLKGQPKSENSDENDFKLLDNPQPSASATRKQLLKELLSVFETLKQLETLKQSKTALLWLTSNLCCLAKIPAVPSGVV